MAAHSAMEGSISSWINRTVPTPRDDEGGRKHAFPFSIDLGHDAKGDVTVVVDGGQIIECRFRDFLHYTVESEVEGLLGDEALFED